MTLPEKQTETTLSGLSSISYNPNVPVVHSLNGYSLDQKGWLRTDKMTWEKDGRVIKFDGAQWKQDGKTVIRFFEDIK